MSASAADIDKALAGFELFQGCTPNELARVSADGQYRRVKASEVVLTQGDFGDSMFFILSGSLVVRTRRIDGNEIVTNLLRKDQTFGELALAGDRPRSATIVANEPAELLEVRRDTFAKVFARNQKVIQRLDRAYRRSAIAANLTGDPLFSDVPSEAVADLVDRARMHSYEKDEVIFEEGDEGDAFYLIWSGHVRVTKRTPSGSERIFAYVAEGDYFGEIALLERRKRTATVIANDHTEVIAIGTAEFDAILRGYPGVARKLRERIVARATQADEILNSETRMGFIDQMVRLGAAHSSTALVINLGTCTRCGACSEACHAEYGNSRLVRRGKTYVLPGSHDAILMPNSCWHCKDPECMSGCPTDALRRGPTGEIQVLVDRCIGCEICANRCPWSNITMADPPGEDSSSWVVRLLRRLLGRGASRVAEVAGKSKVKGKAVKCDLCSTKPYSACVMACPYGAIERVDPNEFLKRAIESGEGRF